MKYIYSNLFRFIRRFPEIGYPQSSSIYGWISHYKPSILGYPHDYGNFHILHANLPIFEVRRILERREAAWPRALHHHGLWAAEAEFGGVWRLLRSTFPNSNFSGVSINGGKKKKWLVHQWENLKNIRMTFWGCSPHDVGKPNGSMRIQPGVLWGCMIQTQLRS